MDSFFNYVREGGLLHSEFTPLVHAIEVLSTVIDLFAIAVLLIGAARFAFGFVIAEFSGKKNIRAKGVNAERVELGRYILAGLEILIVSDIVSTAVSLAMADLVFLGILVVIRSLISFFLERELEAVRRELGADTVRRGESDA